MNKTMHRVDECVSLTDLKTYKNIQQYLADILSEIIQSKKVEN